MKLRLEQVRKGGLPPQADLDPTWRSSGVNHRSYLFSLSRRNLYAPNLMRS
jgi:hypothetical protein